MKERLIFDAHVHVWSDDRQAYPQLPGLERPESHRGSADWLVELMDASEVSGALLVQTPWYAEDNRYLVDTLKRFPGRFAALGYLPEPLAADAPEKLARQYHVDGFRGVRIHLVHADIIAGVADGKADPLIRQAGALAVPVQFLNRVPEQHALIRDLARRFPNVTFINDHLGHPRIGEGYPYLASQTFFDCGRLPNVYAKVSVHHQLSQTGYPWTDLEDFQKLTLDAYGAHKLMWGSNFPMAMPDPTYQQRLDVALTGLPFLTDDERSWILGKTARTLWGLVKPN
ncbi:MAG TPA: amidohydrolase family protein [Chloroflexota bacterium]|nr:amidohydrolase family protein [Chloroflexota bacterium]